MSTPRKSTQSQPLPTSRSDLTSCSQNPRGITRVAARADTLPQGTCSFFTHMGEAWCPGGFHFSPLQATLGLQGAGEPLPVYMLEQYCPTNVYC